MAKDFISDQEMDKLTLTGKAKSPDFIPDNEADKFFGTQKRDLLAPTFPVTGKETPIQAGFKATGNLPTSAARFGKGILDIALNPVETAKAVGSTVIGGAQKLIPGQQEQEESFNLVANALKERYGSLEALQRTAIEDPFGFGSDIVGILGGGATLAGKAGTVSKAIGATGRMATAPVKAGFAKTVEGIGTTARFGLSQSTGLNPETITQIIKNPQALKNVSPDIRIETAKAVGSALDERLEELSGLGKGYEEIRNKAIPVSVPKNIIPTVLGKYGVKLDENGKIITTPESRPLSSVDRASLQDFIDNYGSQSNLTSNSFLNVREALSNLSRFEQGKTSLPQQIARDLRAEYDAVGKAQIKGLKELDQAYAPERQLLSQLKRDIFDSKTGDLKDGAISKIANITGKGKENLLARVKQVVPDIEERVKLIKTIEDIENASGFKTGTYIRGAVTGGGVLTGNIPVIISAILSQPEIAVPLLKGFGYTGQKARPILEAVKNIANDINNFRIPKPLLNKSGQLKAGMSIEDVTKTGGEDLIQEAKKYKSAEEFVKAQGQSVFRGGDNAIDVSRGGGRGISVSDKETAGLFTPPKGGVIDEAILPKTAKILKEGDIPKNLQDVYIKEAKVLANPNNFSTTLQKSVIEKQQAIVDYARKNGFDAVEFPFEKEVRIVKPGVLKTKSQLEEIWKKANKPKPSGVLPKQ